MTSHLSSLFPALRDFRVTSSQDIGYNCVAWAAGADTRWWWPNADSYWPPEVPRENSVSAFIQAFGTLGYEPCGDGKLEEGFEKVAIYRVSTGIGHVARQLPTGRWTSKIGQLEDIEHASPAELEGIEYGTVVQFLRRAIGEPPGVSTD